MDQTTNEKRVRYFTDSEKHRIIQDYLSSNENKTEIWRKHTGDEVEHGKIIQWMRKFGYKDKMGIQTPVNTIPMARNKKFLIEEKQNQNDEHFEKEQLKKRVAELEQKLKDAEMKAIAFSTMVDIAEKEFNIPIRKKYNTKP
jgi:transposase-like protein